MRVRVGVGVESKKICGDRGLRECRVRSEIFQVAMELRKSKGRMFGYAEKGGLKEKDGGKRW